MKRRLSVMLAVLLFVINLTACTNKEDVKDKEQEIKEKTIKITYFKKGVEDFYPFKDLNDIFEERTGTKIEIDYRELEEEEEIAKTIMTKAKAGDIGDLIFFSNYGKDKEINKTKLIYKLESSGAIEDAREEMKNHKNLLSIHGRTPYIPVTMLLIGTPIHKELIEEYDIGSETFVNMAQLGDIMKKFAGEEKIVLSRKALWFEFSKMPFDFYSSNDGKYKINYEKFKLNAEKLKETVLKNYEIDYKDRSIKDIENILLNYTSEARKYDEKVHELFLKDKRIGGFDQPINLFEIRNKIPRQYIPDGNADMAQTDLYEYTNMDIKICKDYSLGSEGFVLMSNSKNKKEAIEFLDFVISDEGQTHVIKNATNKIPSYYAPVVKNSYELLEPALELVNNNGEGLLNKEVNRDQKEFVKRAVEALDYEYKIEREKEDRDKMTIESIIYKYSQEVWFKYIFDVDYTESMMKNDIKEMENKLNIILSEVN